MTMAQHQAEATRASQHRVPLLDIAGPMLRAIIWAVIGFIAGAWLIMLTGAGGFASDRAVSLGFVFATAGWILGGGAWEAAVKPAFGGARRWDEGTGLARYFRFNTDHKVIGLQYLVTSAATFLVAGLFAMVLRYELLNPQLTFPTTAQGYNEAFSVHGSLMLFAVSVVAIVGGFGNYFVPLLIGAEDMTFPRLNGLSWWFLVPGIMAILLSPFVGGFQTGWSGYAPLSAMDATGQSLYFLGVFMLGTSSLLTAINVIATVVWLRAPGLTWGRLPVFVLAMLATSILNLLWVPEVGVGMIFGLLDRLVPTHFFSGTTGLPLLWQDLFWLFGHPEVYIIMLPAWGIWLEIIPVMARKTLFGYRWVIAGLVGVVLLSSVVWTHHMFTNVSDDRLIPFMSTTELISVPTGFMYIAAIGTLWQGRIRLTTPLLLVLMSMFNFMLGGLTGVFLADVPLNFQLHNTYFVVAHFHYTIMGGMVFAWFAGLYYWFPKFTGRMYNEFWGKVNAWWMFAAFNLTFFTMFVSGIDGMNRRIAIYMPYLEGLNRWTSVWAFVLGLGFVIPLVNFLYRWARGPRAAANPWGGKTLEWQTTSPPPHENFAQTPVVTSDFYAYGRVAPEPLAFTVEPDERETLAALSAAHDADGTPKGDDR